MTGTPPPPPPFACQFCGWDSAWPNARQGCPLCYRERLKRGLPANPAPGPGWWWREGEERVISDDDGQIE